MVMPEDEFTVGAMDFLARRGVLTTRVRKDTAKRTPDLRGYSGPDLFAIELKQRDSDRGLRAMLPLNPNVPKLLPPRSILRDPAVQSLIRDSAHQLRGEDDTRFRITWVHCEGIESESDRVQLQNSLLGTEYLIDRQGGGRSYACHFCGESDFYRYRVVLDGAIVSRQVSHGTINISVLLNPYSSRSIRLQTTAFIASLATTSLVNLSAQEAEGAALIADCEIDRRDKKNVLAYICEKYGLDLIYAPITRCGGVVSC